MSILRFKFVQVSLPTTLLLFLLGGYLGSAAIVTSGMNFFGSDAGYGFLASLAMILISFGGLI